MLCRKTVYLHRAESLSVRKTKLIGMELYAETERAMEKALQDECRLHHCKEDLEVIDSGSGKVS